MRGFKPVESLPELPLPIELDPGEPEAPPLPRAIWRSSLPIKLTGAVSSSAAAAPIGARIAALINNVLKEFHIVVAIRVCIRSAITTIAAEPDGSVRIARNIASWTSLCRPSASTARDGKANAHAT